MNELLEFALEAHGGLPLWRELTAIKADLSVTGTLGGWNVSQLPWQP
jgi:hypothetical protein